jgi:hypothetical protein
MRFVNGARRANVWGARAEAGKARLGLEEGLNGLAHLGLIVLDDPDTLRVAARLDDLV